MKRIAILMLLLCAMHPSARAQQADFEREIVKAGRSFADEENIMITQTYLFSRDSSSTAPFDTGVCVVQKKKGTTYISFSGSESFADGSYVIRLNNPARLMTVMKHAGQDTSAASVLLGQSLLGFREFEKQEARGVSHVWHLTGGINGVRSIEMEIDTVAGRIQYILAELTPDNPMLVQYNSDRADRSRRMFIRIAYSYSSQPTMKQPVLADYIQVKNGEIIPAERLADYKIMVAP